jgi:PAS domain S-box-containing protein
MQRFGEAVFEAVVEAIIIVAADGRIVRANRRAEGMFGYGAGELVDHPLEILLPERLQAGHGAQRSGYFQAPRSRSMGLGLDLAGRRKDGTEFPIEVSLSTVRLDEGTFAIAVVSDITERRALERTVRQGEKFAALATLSAGIAHELNNPLSIMASRLELMLSDAERADLPPEVRHDLGVLQRNLERVHRISRSLLSFARQSPHERRPTDLNAVVEETLVLMAKQLSKDAIAVTTALDRSLPSLHADATALEQVLMNLILNARDAMPGGGDLHIETGPAPEPRSWVRLVVADTGEGIAPENLPRVAEAFYTTKRFGTGLGLAVSYRIVAEHGGTVAVESVPGRGTRFILGFPSGARPAGP